eukprot:4842851-Alexandrium_andersonii.AAC.1
MRRDAADLQAAFARCRRAQRPAIDVTALRDALAARAASTGAALRLGTTRFDDSPEVLPDGRITNAEMRR